MAENSKVSRLQVDLLFHKAHRTITLGLWKLKRLHNYLAEKAGKCLEQLPIDRRPTENELTTAFDDVREHTQSSEPYFWERAYRLLSDSGAGSIAFDTAGRAHVFQVVVDEEPDLPPAFNDLNRNDIIETITRWQCNTHVCEIAADMVDGTVKMLKLLQSTPSSRCCNLYTGLNKCQAEARADRLGHPIYCHPDHHQCTSLLLPVRTLAVHYPFSAHSQHASTSNVVLPSA